MLPWQLLMWFGVYISLINHGYIVGVYMPDICTTQQVVHISGIFRRLCRYIPQLYNLLHSRQYIWHMPS